MAISEGDTLPDGIFRRLTEDGLEERSVRDIVAGRKVLLIGMPGAYTNTCSGLHMPSLVRQADAIRAKGVDEIVVFVVNDRCAVGECLVDTQDRLQHLVPDIDELDGLAGR